MVVALGLNAEPRTWKGAIGWIQPEYLGQKRLGPAALSLPLVVKAWLDMASPPNSKDIYPDAPWCWNIYLHYWAVYRVDVGRYSSTMEHMGQEKFPRFHYNFTCDWNDLECLGAEKGFQIIPIKAEAVYQ